MDHLGNNRVVAKADGSVIQSNHYYPFGMAFAEGTVAEQGKQPYKYNGKELDQAHGLNWYDYGARYYDVAIGRWNAVDPIAERIRSLGEPAPGSYAQFARLSSLADAPETPPRAEAMIQILVDGHQATARSARSLFPVADEAGDQATADLATQRVAVHEKAAWMLRALLDE